MINAIFDGVEMVEELELGLGLLIGIVIGLFLVFLTSRIVRALRDRKLRAKHLANCEICRRHRDES